MSKNIYVKVFHSARMAIFVILIIAAPLVIINLVHQYDFPSLYYSIPIIWGVLILLLNYFAIGEIALKHDENQITFKWIRPFLFQKENSESIAIKDIQIAVVSETKKGNTIEKIITANKTYNCNFINARKVGLSSLNKTILKTIVRNNGIIIYSDAFAQVLKNNNRSGLYVVLSVILVFVLIPSLWEFLFFESLYVLIIPVVTFIAHFIVQRNKKQPENIAEYYRKAILRDKID